MPDCCGQGEYALGDPNGHALEGAGAVLFEVAVADNQDAHNIMADYFYSDGSGINGVIVSLADAFYKAAVEQRTVA